MQEIKKLFFTYRNGAVADSLRRYGLPYKVIFGLEIPRIAEIAGSLAHDSELAERLWADRDVRESRLLATYLFDPAEVGVDRAIELASQTRTQEESDMLAFRLLKRMPQAADLLARLESSPSPEARRTAQVLRRHLE